MANHIYNIDVDNQHNGELEIKDISGNKPVKQQQIANISTNAALTTFTSSIATIFQRMRLFEQAFEANQSNAAISSVLHQQVISECFDVFELIFKYPENIVYKVWNKETRVAQLRQKGFNRFSNLLENFWAKDMLDSSGLTLEEVVLIYYKPSQGNPILLGGNSPHTLFFTSPNWGRQVKNLNLPPQQSGTNAANTYRLFETVTELQYRDKAFINFIIDFAKITEHELPALLTQYLRNKHSGLYQTATRGLEVIPDVEILLRFMLRKRSNNAINNFYRYFKIGDNSYAFPTLAQILHESVPNEIPANSKIINADTLFTDNAFRVPFEIQKDKFIYPVHPDEKQDKEQKFDVALPLKVEFFKYFKDSDIQKNLRLKDSGTILKVELSVSTQQGRKVILQKNVKQPSMADAYNFNFAIAPMMAQNTHFWVKSIYAASRKIGLKFYNSQLRPINVENTPCNEPGLVHENYYFNNSFKFIELTNIGVVQGILIPKFSVPVHAGGVAGYTFAIDFGTTNTFVAYYTSGVNDSAAMPLELKQHIILLSPNSSDQLDGFKESLTWLNKTFLPLQLDHTSLPSRTAIYNAQGVRAMNDWRPVIDENYLKYGNIGFNYSIDAASDASMFLGDGKYLTNVKWDPVFRVQSQLFIRELLWLVKMKASGLPFKIVFTYPLSIDTSDSSIFKQMVEDEVNKIFRPLEPRLSEYSESVAPFYYGSLNLDHTYINIDIGGGSTDILLATPEREISGHLRRERKMFATSLRYGANFIWWSGLRKTNANSNGFVSAIKTHGLDKYQIIQELIEAYESKCKPAAEDILSLALGDENRLFTQALEAGNLKNYRMVLFLHFSSVIYHISCLLRDVKAYDTPIKKDDILLRFTGKGSLYLNLLFSNQRTVLTNTIKLLLSAFLGTPIQRLTVSQLSSADAKQATAIGALNLAKQRRDNIPEPISVIHSGISAPSSNIKMYYEGESPFQVSDVMDDSGFTKSLETTFAHYMSVLRSKPVRDKMIQLNFNPPELAYLDVFESMAKEDFAYILGYEVGNSDSVLGIHYKINSCPFFWFFQESLSRLARYIHSSQIR